MQQITSITNHPKQRMILNIENNDKVDFMLYYLPRQQSWFYNFTYNNLTYNGARVTLTPNTLRQFKNIIPFGIAFLSNDNVEPFSIDDFSSGRVGMYILNKEDVKLVESVIFNL